MSQNAVPTVAVSTSATDNAAADGCAAPGTFHVILRADATPSVGVGHAMRLLALSQELISRGLSVGLVGDVEVPWVQKGYEEAGVALVGPVSSPAELVRMARTHGARAVVLDRYDLGPSWGEAARAAGLRVLAMADGPFGSDQVADVYVDQNPGAQERDIDAGQIAVAGARYTLFRDDVLAQRGDASLIQDPVGRPMRVLAVFGGTDPFGAGEVVVPLLLSTGVPVEVTWVRPVGAASVDVTVGAGQSVTQVGPLSKLAEAARGVDVVVTAAGSSVWELMCVGVPVGVVCVTDNQLAGYRVVIANRWATGVGELERLRDGSGLDAAREDVRVMLTDVGARREMAVRSQQMLDGLGRARVADLLIQTT